MPLLMTMRRMKNPEPLPVTQGALEVLTEKARTQNIQTQVLVPASSDPAAPTEKEQEHASIIFDFCYQLDGLKSSKGNGQCTIKVHPLTWFRKKKPLPRRLPTRQFIELCSEIFKMVNKVIREDLKLQDSSRSKASAMEEQVKEEQQILLENATFSKVKGYTKQITAGDKISDRYFLGYSIVNVVLDSFGAAESTLKEKGATVLRVLDEKLAKKYALNWGTKIYNRDKEYAILYAIPGGALQTGGFQKHPLLKFLSQMTVILLAGQHRKLAKKIQLSDTLKLYHAMVQVMSLKGPGNMSAEEMAMFAESDKKIKQYGVWATKWYDIDLMCKDGA
ncbi:hypothetical protein BT96DRAFT_936727 [Gymnopus androsaceus JB14]|uniref:Uncharacterized protein n=1 Tax=Gymnopus androsaceus JB14 TaxID=1447944 RepID=A0A6A4I1C5_9AGAR|nr:hypothetical protein BT96DRAFT_936727 [Gymnopus androsaceus JB14]